MAVDRKQLVGLRDCLIRARTGGVAAAVLAHHSVEHEDGRGDVGRGDTVLLGEYEQGNAVQDGRDDRDRDQRLAARTAVEQLGKAEAENVDADEDGEDLQDEQRADAERRVCDNVDERGQGELREARRERQVGCCCGEDQHKDGARVQTAAAATEHTEGLVGVEHLDVLVLLLLLGGDACGASLLARDALRLFLLGSGSGLCGLFCLLFFAFRELFLALGTFFGSLFRSLLLVLCGFGLARGNACGTRVLRLCLGSGGRSGRRSLALGFRRSLYRRLLARRLCGGRGRLAVYRLAVRRLGLGFGRGSALYLGDDRLKVEITGIRNVVQQILELVQIKFIFLIHDVTSFICLVSQTAAERFEQQDRCGIGGVE